jgi:hypothetical protein
LPRLLFDPAAAFKDDQGKVACLRRIVRVQETDKLSVGHFGPVNPETLQDNVGCRLLNCEPLSHTVRRERLAQLERVVDVLIAAAHVK